MTAALLAALLTPRPRTSTGFAMGSVLTQTHWGKDSSAPEEILRSIQQLERELNEALEAPYEALAIQEDSNGAFDPFLGALTALWNIDSRDGSPPYLPDQEEIEHALRQRRLDLGAYGKGAGCGAALGVLADRNTRAAVINLGGNILVCGRKPWFRPFKIALRDPKGGQNDSLGVFTLRGTYFISTSGSYEKFFEKDGRRYHHIFDPQTGYPAEREPGLISVTVLGINGAVSDMLSTACFVRGYETGLLEEHNFTALFVYEDGTVRGTGDIQKYFRITNKNYHWSEL
ncbi:MAG: FAD:protein FMN transferase [Oscillospiraceae bacterium]|nr:FAD:protein FMN transferase [Oscillospiraceae bacterium]